MFNFFLGLPYKVSTRDLRSRASAWQIRASKEPRLDGEPLAQNRIPRTPKISNRFKSISSLMHWIRDSAKSKVASSENAPASSDESEPSHRSLTDLQSRPRSSTLPCFDLQVSSMNFFNSTYKETRPRANKCSSSSPKGVTFLWEVRAVNQPYSSVLPDHEFSALRTLGISTLRTLKKFRKKTRNHS